MDEPAAKSWKRTSVELPTSMIEQLEQLRREWGLRHRGAVLERLLLQIFEGEADEPALPENLETGLGRYHRKIDERGYPLRIKNVPSSLYPNLGPQRSKCF